MRRAAGTSPRRELRSRRHLVSTRHGVDRPGHSPGGHAVIARSSAVGVAWEHARLLPSVGIIGISSVRRPPPEISIASRARRPREWSRGCRRSPARTTRPIDAGATRRTSRRRSVPRAACPVEPRIATGDGVEHGDAHRPRVTADLVDALHVPSGVCTSAPVGSRRRRDLVLGHEQRRNHVRCRTPSAVKPNGARHIGTTCNTGRRLRSSASSRSPAIASDSRATSAAPRHAGPVVLVFRLTHRLGARDTIFSNSTHSLTSRSMVVLPFCSPRLRHNRVLLCRSTPRFAIPRRACSRDTPDSAGIKCARFRGSSPRHPLPLDRPRAVCSCGRRPHLRRADRPVAARRAHTGSSQRLHELLVVLARPDGGANLLASRVAHDVVEVVLATFARAEVNR